MKAVFLRKMKTTLRSLSTFISIIMPSGFIIIGVFVVCIALTDPNGLSSIYFRRLRLITIQYFMVWAFILNTSSYCGSVVLER